MIEQAYPKSILIRQELREAMNTKFEEGMEIGMKMGMKMGMKKGMEKGIEKGVEKGIEKVAIRCLKAGKTVEETATITGLSIEQVQAISKTFI